MEYRWRRLSLERVEERRLLATDLLAEVLPPPNSSFPQDIAVASDDLAYFYVVDPNYARFQPPLGQLYRTDGTPDGTFSIHSDPRSISDFQHALIVGDKLYYRVGSSLFVTSGTPESTVELTDDGRRLGSDGRLVEFDGHVYFIGRDRDSTRTPDQNNYDLMRTDGTFAGTGYVGPGTTTSRHVWIQGVLDGQLVYHVDAGPVVRTLAAADEAPTDIEGDLSGMKGVRIATTFDGNWIGTGGGELVLIDPANGYERTTVDLHTSRQSLPHQFLTTPHGVFFIALTDEGYAVYRTDGTEMGTQRVGDPDAARPTFPRELVWLQESLVFAAHGNLYRYDPTEDSL